ncbi:MAG: TonB-dependent receptor plug domain-containing protein [Paludibacter sp.]
MKLIFRQKSNRPYLLFCLLLLSSNMLIAADIHKNNKIIQVDSTKLRFKERSVKSFLGGYDVSPQKNPGLITTFDQLIVGKIAGVQIMTNDGEPFNGSSILIRGINSVVGTSQPLIVLDGIPLSYGIKWDDLINQFNPDNIQTVNVLKDAADIARYGMQGANGVIELTTKKAKPGKLTFNFSTTNCIETPGKGTSMLSPDQYRNLVTQLNNAEIGPNSTNWYDATRQNGFTTNNQLSLTGSLMKNIPIRAAVGYLKQDGTIKTERVDMFSGNLLISPSLFNDHLKLNLNLSASSNYERFPNSQSIIYATLMNPTEPIKSNDPILISKYGGYWQSLIGNQVSSDAPYNPVAILNQENFNTQYNSLNAIFDLNYKLHFLPELQLKFMYAINSLNFHTNWNADNADAYYYPAGLNGYHDNLKYYETFDLGLKYDKTFNESHHLIASLAYQSQIYKLSDTEKYIYYNSSIKNQDFINSTDGFASYTYSNAYILTLGLKHDEISHYAHTYSGNFPSASLTYNLSNGFLKGNDLINDLRVKLSYGIAAKTQEFVNTTMFIPTNLTFESTETNDLVVNYGLFTNRLNGEIDFFIRNTSNLTNYVNPSNTTGIVAAYTNSGNINKKGFEFTLNAIPIKTDKLCWSISFNAAYQNSVLSGYSNHILFTNGVNNTYILSMSDGYAPNIFYAFKQKYDTNGKAIEGSYYDINYDGQIDSNDKIVYHSAIPDWIFGFNTILSFGKWDLGCSFRGSNGNYVYNATNAFYGNLSTLYLNNISTDYLNTRFNSKQQYSNYYIEDASFVKMDYFNVGYYFGKISKGVNLKVSATVQNVFTISRYKGVDPEILSGMDYGFYPRPRIFSMKLNLEM